LKSRTAIAGWFIILLLVSVSAGVAILLAQSSYGPGISVDSACYLIISDSLVSGRGYTMPFTPWNDAQPPKHVGLWPPVFPLILALFQLLGFSPIISGAVLNALLLSISVILTAYIAFRLFGSVFISVATGLAMALAPALVFCGSYLLSEMMFILVAVLALWLLTEGILRNSRGRLFVSALLVALASMLRYIGVVLAFTAIIAIFCHPRLSLREGKRWLRALWYSAAANLPLALWLIYNQLASGSPVGPRAHSAFSLRLNLERMLNLFGAWVVNAPVKEWIQTVIGLVLVAAMSALLVLLLLKRRKALDEKHRLVIIVFGGYILLYAIGLVFLASVVKFDPLDLNNRLLAPVVPALLILVFGIAVDWHLLFSPKRWLKMAAIVVFGVWLAVGAFSSAEQLRKMNQQGTPVFSNPQWQKGISELEQILPADRPLVSNLPYPLYIYARRVASFSPTINDDAGEFGEYMAETGAVLVWFPAEWRSYQLSEEELVQGGDLKLIGETEMARVYGSR
jgi:4-amino-4-deoxy-L-arabinose transferase-like glycosyltransferase